jgi:hypothetical protein
MKADIEMNGALGSYTMHAWTETGRDFVLGNLMFVRWQGDPQVGIVIDTAEQAQAIATGALGAGCRVFVNGREI